MVFIIGRDLALNGGKTLSENSLSEEIRERLPRIITSLVVVFFLYLILDITPALVEGITMPGINISLNMMIRLVVLLIIFIFLARILTDIRVLADKVTDPIVRQFGITEEKSMKRVAMDIAYIIIFVLVVEAVPPILTNVPIAGDLLSTMTALVAFGIISVFAYDMGRTLYDQIVRRTDDLADLLTERSKN